MHLRRIMVFVFVAFVLAGCIQTDKNGEEPRSFFIEIVDYDDLDILITAMAENDIVLLGESTHGTQEFYEFRRKITKQLIQDHGFNLIAVEGDWHSIYELNLYCKGLSTKNSAREVLQTFDRWPVWMWANVEIEHLGEWLRDYNHNRPITEGVGIYGLDVYGVAESIQIVQDMTNETYECLSLFAEDFSMYAYYLASGYNPCNAEAEDMINHIRSHDYFQEEYDEKEFFYLKQNAYVVKHAERHYRAMVAPELSSWNERVYHMYHTLGRLMNGKKAIVWAHNTHVGDARATAMADSDIVNIGQLLREAENKVFILGFGTFTGELIAGRNWGDVAEKMTIPEAHPNSYEYVFEQLGMQRSLLMFDHTELPDEIQSVNNNRAIGVVYRPENEYPGNYVKTDLTKRYDAFIFIRDTTALELLP